MTLEIVQSNLSGEIEDIAKSVIDSAFQVHKFFGPGLTEKIYEEAFVRELSDRGIPYERQKGIHVFYKHHDLNMDYKLDLFVSGSIVVEIKCVEKLNEQHTAQIMTYMKLVKSRLGLLINFNAPLLKEGIRRVVI